MISHTVAVIFSLSVLTSSALAVSGLANALSSLSATANSFSPIKNPLLDGSSTQDIVKEPVGLAQVVEKVIDLPRNTLQLATETTTQGIAYAQDIATNGGIGGIFKGTLRQIAQVIMVSIAVALRYLTYNMMQIIPINVREVALNIIDQLLLMLQYARSSVTPSSMKI